MKIRLLIAILFLHSIIFAQVKSNFKITGVTEGDYKGPIFLGYYDKDNNFIKDSTEIVNGKFVFDGVLAEPVQGRIFLAEPSEIGWIYLDTGFISVKARIAISSPNKITLTSVSGSVSDSLFNQFGNFLLSLLRLHLSDSAKNKQMFEKVDSFVTFHPNYNLSSVFLDNAIGANLLSFNQANLIFDHLSLEQRQRAESNGLMRQIERLKKIEVGSPYSFLKEPDTSGNLISGENLIYQYLLIDFWASWCGPCREENPNLRSLYKKYKSKGFEILGVSLDEDKKAWMRAIQKDSIPWSQVSDLKGCDNAIAHYYSVTGIPFNLLVDNKGKIIASNLHGEILTTKLNDLFAK